MTRKQRLLVLALAVGLVGSTVATAPAAAQDVPAAAPAGPATAGGVSSRAAPDAPSRSARRRSCAASAGAPAVPARSSLSVAKVLAQTSNTGACSPAATSAACQVQEWVETC